MNFMNLRKKLNLHQSQGKSKKPIKISPNNIFPLIQSKNFINAFKINKRNENIISTLYKKYFIKNFSQKKIKIESSFHENNKNTKKRLRSAAPQNKKIINKYNSNKNFKTSEKKEARIQIRQRSAFHTNNKEERKQMIRPINLFSNGFMKYIKFLESKKPLNKINKRSKEENNKNKEEISKEKEEIIKLQNKDEEEKKNKDYETINLKSNEEKIDICKDLCLKINSALEQSKEDNKQEEHIKEEKVKEEESPKKPNSIFDRQLCDEIVSSLPKREKTTLKKFKSIIKSKTEDLSEKEKAFVLFKWIGQNIDYDVKNKNAGKKVDCSKEGVFKSGKTVCSGYSNLFLDIALYLNLKVESVSCYAKGAGYIPGEKIYASSTNHEYNVINLDGKWYPIDSTWGAGHSNGNKYIREFCEFYFLADPELLIKTHFPSNEKWQLTKKIYKLSEFEKWPKVFSNFYEFGFRQFYPEEGCLELNDKNIIKFVIYGENMKEKGLMCSISLLGNKGKINNKKEKLSFMKFYNDKIEINCSFNKKGKYLVDFLGNKGDSLTHTSILSYTVKVEKNSKQILTFPETFHGHELINIIEPLNGVLKSGEKVKFKLESDLETIFISSYYIYKVV